MCRENTGEVVMKKEGRRGPGQRGPRGPLNDPELDL